MSPALSKDLALDIPPSRSPSWNASQSRGSSGSGEWADAILVRRSRSRTNALEQNVHPFATLRQDESARRGDILGPSLQNAATVHHSITWSPRQQYGGIVRPRALAVLGVVTTNIRNFRGPALWGECGVRFATFRILSEPDEAAYT